MAGRNTFLRGLRVYLAFDLKCVRRLGFVSSNGYRLLKRAKACDVVAHFDIGRFAGKNRIFWIAWNGATAATFCVADDEWLVASVRKLKITNCFRVTLFALKDVAKVDFCTSNFITGPLVDPCANEAVAKKERRAKIERKFFIFYYLI